MREEEPDMQIGVSASFRKENDVKDHVDFIEENVQGLLVGEKDETAFKEATAGLDESSLPVLAANCFLPGAIRSVGPEIDMDRLRRYVKNVMTRAEQVGIRTIVFGSGGSRKLPDGYDRDKALDDFVEVTKEVAPLAAQHAVTVVIEPLNRGECNFINSLAEGAEVVRRVNHPSVMLLADVYHMLRDGEAAEEIRTYGELLRHVHIAEKEKRSAPGVEGDDFREYFRALKDVRYSGPISMECRWNDFAAEVALGAKTIREQLADAGWQV